MWEKKCWGRVWHLFQSDRASVSFLEVEAGYQCSRHWHRDRANLFGVISGRIRVQVWDHEGELLLETKLGEGEVYTVWSGLVHRFQVIESGQVVEVYWPDATVRQDDIVRLDEGGPVKCFVV